MKVDFNTQFKSVNGIPLIDQDKLPITLASVVVNSLLAVNQNQQTGEHKLKLWLLSKKITEASEPLDITPEEAVLIREEVARCQPPVLSGQTWEFLS